MAMQSPPIGGSWQASALAPGLPHTHLLNHLLDLLLLAMHHVIQVSDPLTEAG